MVLDKKQLKKELETQDNRATDAPLFIVFSKREYPTSEDYHYDRSYYLEHYDCDEVAETKEELIKYLKEEYTKEEYPEEFEVIKKLESDDYHFDNLLWETFEIDLVYVHEVNVYEQAFFTEKGAKDYLKSNGHNLNKPFIYAAGTYRNKEMRAIRDYFMGVQDN